MTIQQFAEEYRLRVRRDECGDPIIPGRRGQLYFVDGQLCLMALDRTISARRTWAGLGGTLWLGSRSPNAKGRIVQDVEVLGIPIENAKAAMHVAGIFPIKRISETRRALLVAQLVRNRLTARRKATSRAKNASARVG